MELRICPGNHQLYRVALVEADDTFTTLSEHDTPEQACVERARLQLGALAALMALEGIAA